MAADRTCFWCSSKDVCWGFTRLVHGSEGGFRVVHEMRRACKDRIGYCLDWQDECQHDPPPESDEGTREPSRRSC